MKQKIFFYRILFVSLFFLLSFHKADAYISERYASAFAKNKKSRTLPRTTIDRSIQRYEQKYQPKKSGWYTPDIGGHVWSKTPTAENTYYSESNPYYRYF